MGAVRATDLDPRAPEVELSIVLPAHNEQENIGAVVQASLRALDACHLRGEVVVVDDGSRDATSDEVRRVAAEDRGRVRLLTHPRNLGYGAAIVNGLLAARGSLLFYTDSDRQFDPADLEHFVPEIDGQDVVFGYRVYRYDPVARSLISWAYNRLIRVLFGVRLRDVDCAFKLLRRDAFERIEPESTDFFIDTELAARAGKWGLRIGQKGVRHYPRPAGETTVRASDIPRTLRTVARMWRRIHLPLQETDRIAREARQRRFALVEEQVLSPGGGDG